MVSVHIEIENYCRHFIKRNTFWESIQEHNKQTRISSISTNVKQAIVSNFQNVSASKMVLVKFIRNILTFQWKDICYGHLKYPSNLANFIGHTGRTVYN